MEWVHAGDSDSSEPDALVAVSGCLAEPPHAVVRAAIVAAVRVIRVVDLVCVGR